MQSDSCYVKADKWSSNEGLFGCLRHHKQELLDAPSWDEAHLLARTGAGCLGVTTGTSLQQVGLSNMRPGIAKKWGWSQCTENDESERAICRSCRSAHECVDPPERGLDSAAKEVVRVAGCQVLGAERREGNGTQPSLRHRHRLARAHAANHRSDAGRRVRFRHHADAHEEVVHAPAVAARPEPRKKQANGNALAVANQHMLPYLAFLAEDELVDEQDASQCDRDPEEVEACQDPG
eukprot:6193453-Pleurochrysis_carterae.AAC.2